ncbi:MAG: phage tail tape measure protein, partial [Acidobacteriota bacterium]
MASEYKILASFQGSAQIIAQFRHIQNEARRTSRTMIEGSRAEARAVQEARRREAQATREAMRAVAEAERAQRRMFRERERLRREDLAAQRRYVAALEKEKSDAEKKRQKSMQRIGVGIAGLGITAGGIKIAADFESSMTALRLSIARARDGAVDMQMLNSQMAELEKLAVELGNTLPGTTKDFVDLFIALKQGGMATEDILGGAGKAIANLAVLTGSEPAVLGKQFAQMGQMFKLKPEEYKAAVEQFHALYRLGVNPEELIESSKFFAPRAGAPLGMTGIEGMTQAGTILGALNRAGLGGGIGGRNVSMMMTRLT